MAQLIRWTGAALCCAPVTAPPPRPAQQHPGPLGTKSTDASCPLLHPPAALECNDTSSGSTQRRGLHLCICILNRVPPQCRHAADPLLHNPVQPPQHNLTQLCLLVRLIQALVVEVLCRRKGGGREEGREGGKKLGGCAKGSMRAHKQWALGTGREGRVDGIARFRSPHQSFATREGQAAPTSTLIQRGASQHRGNTYTCCFAVVVGARAEVPPLPPAGPGPLPVHPGCAPAPDPGSASGLAGWAPEG